MELTRRGLIGRAAAASGALLGAGAIAPGLVFAGPEGEAVFQMRLPRGRRGGSGWTSGVVDTARPFELLGIECQAADQRIEVRALEADGRWGEWLHAHAGRGHGPDADALPSARNRSGSEAARSSGTRSAGGPALTDPVWTGPTRAFQIRSDRPLARARVVLVDPGTPARASAAKRYVDAGLPAGPGQPNIIARSTWATASCHPRTPAAFGEVDLAFVHHTVSSNSYRPSQSAGMVRAICLFHKYGNGWNDIGYNFVVDRYGQIFEARAGGIDETIVGAHAGGYNVYSTGVALLGTYSAFGPSRKTYDALAHLLAWKLSLHRVALPGTTTVTVTQDGAVYSRYRAGTPVTLDRVSGHRDGDTTECPGSGAYRQLPRLRQSVQRLAGTVTALSFALTGTAPGSISVSGQLTFAGAPLAGATIELQSRSSTKGPTTVATATTNPDGTWSATVALATNALLRAVFPGDPAHAAVVSAGVLAQVPPQVTLTSTSQITTPGGVIEFDGSTNPPKPTVTLVISQQQPDGTLTQARTVRVATNPDGTYSRTIGFPDAGQFQVIAHTPADDRNALGTSAPLSITVA